MKCYITIVIIKWGKRWIWYCYVIDDKEHCNTTEVNIVILNINVKQNTCSRSTFIRMCHPSRSLLVRCCGQTRMGLAKLCGWPTFPPRRTAGYRTRRSSIWKTNCSKTGLLCSASMRRSALTFSTNMFTSSNSITTHEILLLLLYSYYN